MFEGVESSTILVVEDNPTNIKVVFNLLRDVGLRVLIAKDGESALKKLEDVLPDLILLDVMMPGISGFETCHLIKENPSTQAIPVIFMTALADTENKIKGFELGAVDYITKPFQQNEVLARVNLHLKLCKLTQELAEKNRELLNLNLCLEEKVEEKTSEIKSMQSQLVLQEKMSSLGQLIAGIAHEIKNPIGFIESNLKPAYDYAENLIDLVKLYQTYYPQPVSEIRERLVNTEFDYVAEDFPQLLRSLEEGTKRLTYISQAMRTFCRSDQSLPEVFDVHQGLDSTLLILKHRLQRNEQRPAIQVIKDYDQLPLITCFPGQLNQVFMNVLANAIDALDEAYQQGEIFQGDNQGNCIIIQTRYAEADQQVWITIQDNGVGIPLAIQKQIFDYLFTTKKVGKGTGLGLSITREVMEHHQGKIEVESIPNQGTTFRLKLPVEVSFAPDNSITAS
ncbi:hybrid sensor histidine kinase/response regulator [Spirulina subsalsa FACHB-351]|uniref:histidine kinase n=1 Tax=Spirulina subsalsa FACHB-351 TaxID=234711 RepID=A0ABT3L0C8_9CYAN|nr:hybrid sensor histidine kinase/response regulator [Spirulina subsalsa]MCW6034957.1 hybrid sensor histidine kinase/response regulator [Spirulina subsalsa FACHB-351]